ncbi:hypothetical protein [Acetivibrio cellulolyticus]|uniref:hypothetical protein n=1 Tax=Acetivibrio cellulolyticus TaxID=35830 RepID=UPI0001E2FB4D|nr:hypothetical protein [Acetivibrio cellulolyticus]
MHNEARSKEKLENLAEHINKLIFMSDEIVNNIYERNYNSVNSSIGAYLDNLQYIIQELEIQKQNHNVQITDVFPYISSMMDAFENVDYIFVADTLEYEMIKVLDGWKTILERDAGYEKTTG